MGTFKNLLIGYITFANLFSYLPQLIQLIKTKNSDGISLSSWFIWIASSFVYLIYSVLSGDIRITLITSVQLIFDLLIFYFSLIYKKPK